MKKSLSLFMLVLILFFASTQDSDAQFRLKLGPYTGMNFNLGTGSDLTETATGFTFFFGSQVDMSFTRTLGLLTQVQFYDGRGIGYSQTGGTAKLITGGLGLQNLGQGTLDTDFSLAYFMIQPLLKLTLPASSFYFVFGPSIGFNISASVREQYTINGQKTYDSKSVSIKELNVRFELTGGAGYDIPLSQLMVLTPQFTFGFGITTVQSDVSARILTFQLGTALKFNLI
jgi:Outer membrane protein beta-barrel domain